MDPLRSRYHRLEAALLLGFGHRLSMSSAYDGSPRGVLEFGCRLLRPADLVRRQVIQREASQLAVAIAPERRQALDGYAYTAEEFQSAATFLSLLLIAATFLRCRSAC